MVNAYDFCLNSALGTTVDERGCEAEAIEPSSDTDGEGMGVTTVLFLLAGAVILYAVYSNMQRPGPPLPKTPTTFEMPPTRPAMDEEA